MLGAEETIMIYDCCLAEWFWLRASHEIAVKMPSGAIVFKVLLGIGESSFKMAIGRSPQFYKLRTPANTNMWAFSCKCITVLMI